MKGINTSSGDFRWLSSLSFERPSECRLDFTLPRLHWWMPEERQPFFGVAEMIRLGSDQKETFSFLRRAKQHRHHHRHWDRKPTEIYTGWENNWETLRKIPSEIQSDKHRGDQSEKITTSTDWSFIHKICFKPTSILQACSPMLRTSAC